MKTIFELLVCIGLLFAQVGKLTFSGNIYDEKNGEALIGASVYLKELKKGASTNLYGFFAIPDIPAGKYQIQITCIGYEPLNKVVEIKTNKIEKYYLKPTTYQLKEIVVKGDSVKLSDQLFTKSISAVELSPVQIKKIPQFVESDLLRTLQQLPGILSGSDYSSALYVRGGRSDQNLFLLDGTDVYNPEHAFGLFSTFNTDAIKKVEMIKGGLGAEYGGRLSSVINIINLDGNRNNFEGNINISLLSAKTTIQTPLGSFGSLSGSYRRTYLDVFASKISDEFPDYYFYDGNIKAFLDLSDKDKLSISFYGGKDDLSYKFDKKNSDSPEINYIWGNRTTSLNYRKILNNDLFANLWVTYSNFNSKFDFNELDIDEKNVIDDVTGKIILEYNYTDNMKFNIGFENKYMYGLYKQKFRGGKVEFNGHKNYFITYFTTQTHLIDDLIMDIGIRYEQFNSDKIYREINPRLSLKYRLDESQTLKFSTGRYSQFLNKIERGFIVGIWTVADKYVPPSSSNHYILGWAKEIYEIYSLEIDGYYKTYKNISILNPYTSLDIEPTNSDPITGEPIFS
ncbi:MAG TPA: TonB-dependent receptor [Ignavibacteriales bacterium]|nr:TonB-dependent receptor [Ignavibacteriales bacterium]HOL80138.1 TonB-dependent receptor [Ignavibacteriales bacterium]HOM65077.1 TonB-dependent receptor [Ignavibacteriales bacterium]HPD67906.1 TonB-dependent receptor [Ignavibacteriales bacterium]HPP32327.1 TonB-dependent receptor [Ignavibacteriales bacterium]